MLNEKTILFLSTGATYMDQTKTLWYPLTKIFKKAINYIYYGKTIKTINNDILNIINNNKIDYVLYLTYKNEVYYSTLDYINSLGIKTLALNPDDHHKQLVNDVKVNECPRCTFHAYNEMVEQVFIKDKMCKMFP